MTKERSIILHPHEVRGLLDGTVTQLWRPAKEFIAHCDAWPDEVYPARESGWVAWWGQHGGEPLAEATKQQYQHGFLCPWGEPGQRLWGREVWTPFDVRRPKARICYRADMRSYGNNGGDWSKVLPSPIYEGQVKRWYSSAQMPHWASRITLEIEQVKPMRVQDVTEADARASGVTGLLLRARPDLHYEHVPLTFRDVWDQDNPRYPWETNPWAWQIVVRRIEP